MKKFLLSIGAIVALTACGGGDEPAPTEDVPSVEEPADTEGEVPEGEGEVPEGEATGDFDATAARDTYEKSCIGCHGGNLEGGAGPALEGTGLSAADIEDIIHNGQGGMPAQNVPDDEAANLAQWIETQ